MKFRRMKGCFTLMLCGMLSLTGCNNSSQNVQETPFYTLTIDGETLYYPENDENVQSLLENAGQFIDYWVNWDYKNPERFKEHLPYYTEENRAYYGDGSRIDSTIDNIVQNKIVQELLESSNYSIQFYSYAGTKMARVVCDYRLVIKEASKEYLEDAVLKLNTNYKRTITIEFEHENGEWKISSRSVTTHEEV